jgi:hypothetical protein
VALHQIPGPSDFKPGSAGGVCQEFASSYRRPISDLDQHINLHGLSTARRGIRLRNGLLDPVALRNSALCSRIPEESEPE